MSFCVAASILSVLATLMRNFGDSSADFQSTFDSVIKRIEKRASLVAALRDVLSSTDKTYSSFNVTEGQLLVHLARISGLEEVLFYSPLSEFVPYLAKGILEAEDIICRFYAGHASAEPLLLRIVCTPFLGEERSQLLSPLQKALADPVSLPSLDGGDSSPSEAPAKQVTPNCRPTAMTTEDIVRVLDLQDKPPSYRSPAIDSPSATSEARPNGSGLSLEAERTLDKRELFVLGHAVPSLLPLCHPIAPQNLNSGFGRFMPMQQTVGVLKLRAASGDLFSLCLLRSGVFGPSSARTPPEALADLTAAGLCAIVAYLDTVWKSARTEVLLAANSLFEGMISRCLESLQNGPGEASKSTPTQISPSVRFDVLSYAIQAVYDLFGECSKIAAPIHPENVTPLLSASGARSYAARLILRDLALFDPLNHLRALFSRRETGLWSSPSFSVHMTELVVASNYDLSFAKRVERALLYGDSAGATLDRRLLVSHAEYCVFSGLSDERERSAMLHLLGSYDSRQDAGVPEDKSRRSGRPGSRKNEAEQTSSLPANSLAAVISFDGVVDLVGFSFTQGQPASLDAKMPIHVSVFSQDPDGKEYLVFSAPLQDNQPHNTVSFYSTREKLVPTYSSVPPASISASPGSAIATSSASSPLSPTSPCVPQQNAGFGGGKETPVPNLLALLDDELTPLQYSVAGFAAVSAQVPPLLAGGGLEYPFPSSLGFATARQQGKSICVRKLKYLFVFDPAFPPLLPRIGVVCREVAHTSLPHLPGDYLLPTLPDPLSAEKFEPRAMLVIKGPNETQHNLSCQLYTRFVSTLINPSYRAFLDACPRRDSMVHLSQALTLLSGARNDALLNYTVSAPSPSPSAGATSQSLKSPSSQTSLAASDTESVMEDKGFPIMELFSEAVSTEKIIKILFLGESAAASGPISRSLQAKVLHLFGQAISVTPSFKRSILMAEGCPMYLEDLLLDPRALGPDAVLSDQPRSFTMPQKALIVSGVDHCSRSFQTRRNAIVLPPSSKCSAVLRIIEHLNSTGQPVAIGEQELHRMREVTGYEFLENVYFTNQTEAALPQYVYKAYYARRCDVRGLSTVPTEALERLLYHQRELGRLRYVPARAPSDSTDDNLALSLSSKAGKLSVLAFQFSVPIRPWFMLIQVSDITALQGVHTFSDLGVSLAFSAIPLDDSVVQRILGLNSGVHDVPAKSDTTSSSEIGRSGHETAPPGDADFFLLRFSTEPEMQTPTILLKFLSNDATLSLVKLFAETREPLPCLLATPFASFARSATDGSSLFKEKPAQSSGFGSGGKNRPIILAPCQTTVEGRLRGFLLLHFCFDEFVTIESFSILAFNVFSPPKEAVVFFLGSLPPGQARGRVDAPRKKECPESADNKLCDVLQTQLLRLPSIPSYQAGPALSPAELGKRGVRSAASGPAITPPCTGLKMAIRPDRNGAYTFRSACSLAVNRVTVALFGGDSEVFKMTFVGRVVKRQARPGR